MIYTSMSKEQRMAFWQDVMMSLDEVCTRHGLPPQMGEMSYSPDHDKFTIELETAWKDCEEEETDGRTTQT